MKKILFTIFMVIVLILSVPSGADAATYAKGIILDGEPIAMEVAPVIDNGRTLVPVRGVLEAMGASVTWDPSTKTATALYEGISVSVTIDKFKAYVDGNETILDVPAKIIDGRTMVPLRFVAEAIGYDVDYKDGWIYLDYSEFYALLDQFNNEIVQPEFASKGPLVTTTYNDELNAVVISIEADGFAKELMALGKDKSSKKEWTEFMESMKLLSNSVVEYFDASGYDVDGIVEVINDEDSEFIMIEVKNGIITYDETTQNQKK